MEEEAVLIRDSIIGEEEELVFTQEPQLLLYQRKRESVKKITNSKDSLLQTLALSRLDWRAGMHHGRPAKIDFPLSL